MTRSRRNSGSGAGSCISKSPHEVQELAASRSASQPVAILMMRRRVCLSDSSRAVLVSPHPVQISRKEVLLIQIVIELGIMKCGLRGKTACSSLEIIFVTIFI